MLKLLVVCEAVVEIYNKHYFNNGLDAMISNYSRITSNITCLNYGINVDVVTNGWTGEKITMLPSVSQIRETVWWQCLG